MKGEFSADRLLYFYGTVSRDEAPPQSTTAHLQGVAHGALMAIVESVSTDDFAPDVLDQKLESVEWVSALARRHEAVLEAMMEQGPVVPARLCTIFSRAEALQAVLAENHEQLLATLRRFRGRKEWGLKLFYDNGRLQQIAGERDSKAKELAVAATAAQAGQAYVMRKRRDARLAEVAAARIDAAVDSLLGLLDSLPIDIREKPLLPPEATGRSEWMALNLAVLVHAAALDAFRANVQHAATELDAGGIVLELSGPWPPYSFCSDDDMAVAGDAAAPAVQEGGSSPCRTS